MFRLIVKPDTLEMSRLGSICGQIWLEIDDVCFPGAAYSDMVVVLLWGWADQVISLHYDARSVRCNFMDGPYYLNIAWLGTSWRIRCMRRGSNRAKCLVETVQQPLPVVNAIKLAARKTLAECNRREWDNADVQQLNMAVRTLSRPV